MTMNFFFFLQYSSQLLNSFLSQANPIHRNVQAPIRRQPSRSPCIVHDSHPRAESRRFSLSVREYLFWFAGWWTVCVLFLTLLVHCLCSSSSRDLHPSSIVVTRCETISSYDPFFVTCPYPRKIDGSMAVIIGEMSGEKKGLLFHIFQSSHCVTCFTVNCTKRLL